MLNVQLTDEELYKLLLRERHNATRARAFDDAKVIFPYVERAWVERQIVKFMEELGLNENEAKALLAETIHFYHLKVDEQDKRRRKGEAVRDQIEWLMIAKVRREEVPA